MKRTVPLGQCEADVLVSRCCLACRSVLSESMRCERPATHHSSGKPVCRPHRRPVQESCVYETRPVPGKAA